MPPSAAGSLRIKNYPDRNIDVSDIDTDIDISDLPPPPPPPSQFDLPKTRFTESGKLALIN